MKNYSTFFCKNNMITILNIEAKDEGAFITIDKELSYFIPAEAEMENHLIEVGGIKIDENDNYEISDCLYCYKKIDLIAYNLTKKTQDYKLLCYYCFIDSCKHKLVKEELIMLTIINLNTINKESYLKIYEILSKITRLKQATIIEALVKFSEKYDFFYSKEEKVVLNIKKIKDNYKALNENSFHRLVDYEIENIRELEEFWEQ